MNAEKSAVRHPSKAHFLGFRFLCRAVQMAKWHPAVSEDETTTGGDHEGDDASESGRSITTCMDGFSRHPTGWMAHYRLVLLDAVQGLGVLN